ncbi:uncharacterized protein LOC107225488 isoform X11 [Neodiprion lecontei]|uniref:Uncharacterized protein LOC107225488 isoform X11 n=1 Tax=Neodiprion lecontei TaxID=441921 RepID=A0ABM3G5I6_NEOLC|nr:uncharacterized protein LOC107225488 isoform X11 [Neodiprion lecontei]
MRTCGSYDVNAVEGGGTESSPVQRKPIFIVKLILFLVLCAIIITLCILWVSKSKEASRDNNIVGKQDKLRGRYDGTSQMPVSKFDTQETTTTETPDTSPLTVWGESRQETTTTETPDTSPLTAGGESRQETTTTETPDTSPLTAGGESSQETTTTETPATLPLTAGGESSQETTTTETPDTSPLTAGGESRQETTTTETPDTSPSTAGGESSQETTTTETPATLPLTAGGESSQETTTTETPDTSPLTAGGESRQETTTTETPDTSPLTAGGESRQETTTTETPDTSPSTAGGESSQETTTTETPATLPLTAGGESSQETTTTETPDTSPLTAGGESRQETTTTETPDTSPSTAGGESSQETTTTETPATLPLTAGGESSQETTTTETPDTSPLTAGGESRQETTTTETPDTSPLTAGGESRQETTTTETPDTSPSTAGGESSQETTTTETPATLPLTAGGESRQETTTTETPDTSPSTAGGESRQETTTTDTPDTSPLTAGGESRQETTTTETPDTSPLTVWGESRQETTTTETPDTSPLTAGGESRQETTTTETPDTSPSTAGGESRQETTTTETPDTSPLTAGGESRQETTTTETPDTSPFTAGGESRQETTTTDTPDTSPLTAGGESRQETTTTETPDTSPLTAGGESRQETTTTDTPDTSPLTAGGESSQETTTTETPATLPLTAGGESRQETTTTETPDTSSSTAGGESSQETTTTETPATLPLTAGGESSQETTTTETPATLPLTAGGESRQETTTTETPDTSPLTNHMQPVTSSEVMSKMAKGTTSRILSYMNHSSDACDDFYEYACGEFEDNQLMTENDLAEQAMQRIFTEAQKRRSDEQSFLDYYESCLNYEKTTNQSERLANVRRAVQEIGRFNYMDNIGKDDTQPKFRDTLQRLLERNSALLFDITPDLAVNEGNCNTEPQTIQFTWKIGPLMSKTDPYTNKRAEECYKQQESVRNEPEVNLTEVYGTYKECKNYFGTFTTSIKNSVKKIFGTDYDRSEQIGVDVEKLIELFLVPEMDEDEIRKAYATKNYNLKGDLSVRRAHKQPPFLDFKKLLPPRANVERKLWHGYLPEDLTRAVKNVALRSYQIDDETWINDALLAIYAHDVYHEFVAPRHDVENYCKRLATNLMKTHASSLYMSSFKSEELKVMNRTVTEMFEKLRKTLESNVSKQKWIGKKSKEAILKKIARLSIVTPAHRTDYHNSNDNEIELTGDFFNDTMALRKMYRTSMYQMLDKRPSEEIWTYFAQPYDASTSSIYELEKIIIPFGAVDWRFLDRSYTTSTQHLGLATLGTLIANEIAHHFDFTGINYLNGWKGRRVAPVFCSNTDDDINYRSDYKNHYQNLRGKMDSIFLPSTSQNIHYSISDLSLNERFSDDAGLRLAYDTMLNLPAEAKIPLPWLSNSESNEIQQFFLAYAQMHCTKKPLTTSFRSLYEDENLPSRLRIAITAANNEALGEAWQCKTGTKVRPEEKTYNFPHLDGIDFGRETEALPPNQ